MLVWICLNLIFWKSKSPINVLSSTETSEAALSVGNRRKTSCPEQLELSVESTGRPITSLWSRISHLTTHTSRHTYAYCTWPVNVSSACPSKPPSPLLLMLWAISAMAFVLDWNMKTAGKAAIKLIFNRSQLITFLYVCVSLCTGWGWGHERWLPGQFNKTVVTPDIL